MATETFNTFFVGSAQELFWQRSPVGAQAVQLAMDAVAQCMGIVVVNSVRPALIEIEGGSVIEIRGSNFTGATGVTIGGTACTGVVVVNDGLIRCIAPVKAAGTYDVIVLSPLGNVTLAASVTAL